MYKALKPMLERSIVDKTVFTKDLTQYITPEQLPVAHGGKSTYTFTYTAPKPDEKALQGDATAGARSVKDDRSRLIADFEDLTRRWAQVEENEVLGLRRQLAAEAIRRQYFELEPDIRGGTIYDRDGTFKNDLVIFRSPQADGSVASTALCHDRGLDAIRERIAELEDRLKALDS